MGRIKLNQAGGFAALVLLLIPFLAAAGEIQFYKINKKGQQSEYMFIGDRDEAGCHNMRSRDVFRVAQIGFVYCTVYSEKDCKEGSELIMHWKGKVKKDSVRGQPTERLMQGTKWYFKKNDTKEISSWRCEE